MSRRNFIPLLLLAALRPAAAKTDPAPTPTPVPVIICPVCTNPDGTIKDHCLIKGNINWNGEYIYHCPRWRDYDKTDMGLESGERWFCTESEAVLAGWRKPKYKTGPCR